MSQQGLVFNWSPVYQNALETNSFSSGETNSCRSRRGVEGKDNSPQKQKRSTVPPYNPFGQGRKADLQPSMKVQ